MLLSGREIPVHLCSLAWIRAGRAAITPLRVQQNRTNMNVLQISLIQDFKIQHNLRIYSNSRGIKMANPDLMRGGGGAGEGGG